MRFPFERGFRAALLLTASKCAASIPCYNRVTERWAFDGARDAFDRYLQREFRAFAERLRGSPDGKTTA
jgi:hypothetical protein